MDPNHFKVQMTVSLKLQMGFKRHQTMNKGLIYSGKIGHLKNRLKKV